MTKFATLTEAIDDAREFWLEENPDIDEEEASVAQFNLQKYVMQDGDIMWEAEFCTDENDEGELQPMRSGEAAQAVFEDDYDEIELNREWLEDGTLHEWDEGEFQYAPRSGSEERDAADEEWQDDDSESDNY